MSAAQVALAWLLTRPTVSSVIVGARTDEQLADNLQAAELQLSGDELAALEQVSRPNLLYPYWHQWLTGADRLSPADLTLIGPYIDGACLDLDGPARPIRPAAVTDAAGPARRRQRERQRRPGRRHHVAAGRLHLASSSSCQ